MTIHSPHKDNDGKLRDGENVDLEFLTDMHFSAARNTEKNSFWNAICLYAWVYVLLASA
jgi:hypothetical protein